MPETYDMFAMALEMKALADDQYLNFKPDAPVVLLKSNYLTFSL